MRCLTLSLRWTVYAIFRARVRTIDAGKKASLRQQLLAEIMARPPEDRLEDELSKLTMDDRLPPPSDDKVAWWNGPDGSFSLEIPTSRDGCRTGHTNPFSEELFSSKPVVAAKPSIGTVRRKPPPAPTSIGTSLSKNDEVSSSPSADVPPSSPSRTKPPIPARPRAMSGRSTATQQSVGSQEEPPSTIDGSWQVIDSQK